MRALFFTLTLLSSAFITSTGYAQTVTNNFPAWPSGHSSVLKGEQALTLGRQCSRPSVQGVDSSWTPSPQIILRLELKLNEYLSKHYPKIRQQIQQVYFQYAGLKGNKRKIIYINAIDQHAQNNPDWRKNALVICDGGEVFWGTEFDPVTERFSPIHFNGSP
ncbi:hypothetical protein H8K33_16560 [Undibacterium amnicola]|uniref:Uncharacterized protein n=1 Tax=Undibacterium amnicola TaxID=1834038 RepID=A0ABR6XVZ1_9BURK|nr:hypothetical protein [Undibacterium amnicola]MBC3833122.1 hypothetical protein [Undibacterium amnicola]